MSTGTSTEQSKTTAGRAVGAAVDPGWIADRLDDPLVRVVEVDVSRGAYDGGHIPGAVLWNAYSDLRRPDYTPIDADELAELLSRSGITPEHTVVLYGYAGYLGFWLMKRYRHPSVYLMDGPRDKWADAGHRWSTEAPGPEEVSYRLPTEDEHVVTARESLQQRIGDPATLILDVRSREEYDGERFWPSGATEDTGRTGHIPGAVHLPCDLIRAEDGGLRSPQEIRAAIEAAGITPDRRVITYCTIGNRASQVWFALKYVLGYPEVSVYYGSWVEWGRLENTPIE